MDVLTVIDQNIETVFPIAVFLLTVAGIDLYLIKRKIKQIRTLFDELDIALEDDRITNAEWNERIKPAIYDLFGSGIGALIIRLFRRG